MLALLCLIFLCFSSFILYSNSIPFLRSKIDSNLDPISVLTITDSHRTQVEKHVPHGKSDSTIYRNLLESGTKEESDANKESNGDFGKGNGHIRTATGGFINKILIIFSIIAFLGNSIFMINVFWLSRYN